MHFYGLVIGIVSAQTNIACNGSSGRYIFNKSLYSEPTAACLYSGSIARYHSCRFSMLFFNEALCPLVQATPRVRYRGVLLRSWPLAESPAADWWFGVPHAVVC
jgi:hypothetical protein